MAKKRLVYDADSIDVNLGLDAVRKSPQVYIGNPDSDGIFHILKEPIDNAIDECLQAAVKNKTIGIAIDGPYLWVWDQGRGIPVDQHKVTKISTLTTVLTTLSSGGKMREGGKAGYEKTRGIHGMGVALTNAMSAHLEVWTYRSGWYYQKFFAGKPAKPEPIKTEAPKLPGNRHIKHGTVIKFTPDFSLFDKGSQLSVRKLRNFLRLTAYLHPDITLQLIRGKKFQEYHQPRGLLALIERQLKDLAVEANGKVFQHHDELIDAALVWSTHTDEATQSFINGSPTADGGTHVQGLNQAINEALNPFKGKRAKFRAEDLRAGLICVINVKVDRPRFTSQTKEKLGMPEVTENVKRALIPALAKFFAANKPLVREILRRASEQFKANEEFKVSKKAAAELKVSKQGKLLLPEKLMTALTNKPMERELFLVEGDSAGGTARRARDAKYQEVLPLRGKILNVNKAQPSKVIANIPVRQILQAVGYDPQVKNPLDKLRVGKIMFLADGDSDGEHISLLLSGLFQKILPTLLQQGRIYVVDAPLFTAQVGAKRYYAATREALEKQLPRKVPITRIKGWGEINADLLAEVAFDPKTRGLKRLLPISGKELQEFNAVLDADTDFRKTLLGVK